ncbi:hypothetical protein SH139x_002239 [Planctomycetaceae bacterium SH139]
MQVIDEKLLNEAKLADCERFFVEVWYSLTHFRSLDSFRVRCLNSRTVIGETLRELRIGRIKDDDLGNLLSEVEATLDRDPVVSTNFQPQKASLSKHFAIKAGKHNKQELQFDIEDANQIFKKHYFTSLCEQLPLSIRANDSEATYWLASAIASDLVDRGWTLETLFTWHRNFLIQKDRGFDSNLTFMLRQFRRQRQSFQVVLRVSGSSRTRELAGEGTFLVSHECPLEAEKNEELAICTANANVTFASYEVKAIHFADAATKARTSFEQLLDLLRFEYERKLVAIDEDCLVHRLDDKKRQIVKLEDRVPNPVESLQEGDFASFVKQFNAVINNDRIESTSRRLIQAATRQYRFGCDSASYKDKFVNWWMGLEALSHAHGDIGKTVARHSSNCMLHGYPFRLCRDLLTTIKYCRIEWPAHFAQATGCDRLRHLSVSGLLTLLQDQAKAAEVQDSLSTHPNAQRFSRLLSEWLQDPKKLYQQLESHHLRLQWHLARLYRIRCCIVHGSPVKFQLPLFTANLEYYLKQMILFALNSLNNHDQVNKLDDVYRRVELSNRRNLERLKDKSADASTIREVIFASLVVK